LSSNTVTTSVIVENGGTVVIGGLSTEAESQTVRRGCPSSATCLMSAFLFKTTSKNSSQGRIAGLHHAAHRQRSADLALSRYSATRTAGPAGPSFWHCYNPPVNTRNNIFLVGMPGAGKTTVGRQLARRMQRVSSMPIMKSRPAPASGFRSYSISRREQGFREREAKVIAELASEPIRSSPPEAARSLRPENRAALRQGGTVIYLQTRPRNCLYERTRLDPNRPLLQVDDPRKKLEDLFAISAIHCIARSRTSLSIAWAAALPSWSGKSKATAKAMRRLNVELAERGYEILIGTDSCSPGELIKACLRTPACRAG
jgi:shikimate kinase